MRNPLYPRFIAANLGLRVSSTTSTSIATGLIPTGSSTGARPPELLAPAGDWDCAKAAVENGADAIYFGLERFNARMRAQNFTEGVLPRLMAISTFEA